MRSHYFDATGSQVVSRFQSYEIQGRSPFNHPSTALVRFLCWRMKSAHRQSGFTLIEVIVAMLVLSLFISIAMTGLSLSVVLKVRSRISTEATNWIQQDLEAVRSQANRISYTLSTNATAGQPYITLASASGLVPNEHITIGRSNTIYTIHSVNGNIVRLTSNLLTSQPATSNILALDKCEATTVQSGFAYVLQQTLPPLQNGGGRTISGRTYTLRRDAIVSAEAPHEVLQIAYSVFAPNASLPISTMYTEVIPNVAFQCPRAD